jgi:hypothetical protein
MSCTLLTPLAHRFQATEKLVSEFNFIRSNAVEPLSTFLDYMTYVSGPRALTCSFISPLKPTLIPPGTPT